MILRISETWEVIVTRPCILQINGNNHLISETGVFLGVQEINHDLSASWLELYGAWIIAGRQRNASMNTWWRPWSTERHSSWLRNWSRCRWKHGPTDNKKPCHEPTRIRHLSGWWWLEHEFYFPIQLGIIIPIDFHIFQRSWNRQPVVLSFLYHLSYRGIKM